MNSFLEEIKCFCTSTSVKGIPRIVKSPTKGLSLMWTIAVMVCLALMLYQISTLLCEYFAYPKITVTSEKMLNTTDTGYFPDIVVCNVNPISSLNVASSIPTIEEFRDRLQNVTTCSNCTEEEQQLLAELEESLLKNGYFQYIGKDSVIDIGHDKEDLLASCHLMVIDGLTVSKISCKGKVNITLEVTPSYYNCYRMHLLGNDSKLGISIVLYLDNVNLEKVTSSDIIESSSGVVVTLTEPGMFMTMERDGLRFSPSTVNEVKLLIEHRIRLREPYGVCTTSYPYHFAVPYRYNTLPCSSVCLELEVAKECSCRDFLSYSIIADMMTNLPYCGDIKASPKELLQRMTCAQNVRKSRFNECFLQCPQQCEEMIYSSKTTQTMWSFDNIPHLYQKLVKGHRYEKIFEEAWLDYNENKHERNNSELLFLMRKNFLIFSVELGDYRYMQMEDVPKLTVTNLLSQLGGTLNLWAGITVIVIVEIIEMLVKLVPNNKVKTGSEVESKKKLPKPTMVIDLKPNK